MKMMHGTTFYIDNVLCLVDSRKKLKNHRGLCSMAATVSLSFSLEPQNHRFSSKTHFKPHPTLLLTPLPPTFKYPLHISRKYNRYAFKSSSSSSHSTPSIDTSSSYPDDLFRTGRFLCNEELEKLKLLGNFEYYQELESGSLSIRVMRAEEMDTTVALLAESFAESMLWPSGYLSLLRFLVKQYLIERRALMPHTATLIGFYRGKENGISEQEEQLAGTVEVCFDKRGANASPPTPTSPNNSPYISNMAVKKPLRRSVSCFQCWIFTIMYHFSTLLFSLIFKFRLEDRNYLLGRYKLMWVRMLC